MEPEFDANERDAWYALEEHRGAICPDCGNYRAICSTPGGLSGEGYNIHQDVCYARASREATLRRIARKFEKATPDLQGGLPTDGVSIAVTLTPDDSEDVLGLAALGSALGPAAAPSGELDPENAQAHHGG